MRNIFGLGKKEAEAITLDVTSKVYRKRLAQAVTGGDLEMADSKAAFLQNLCDELHFDPQKASGIHEGNGSCGISPIENLVSNIRYMCIYTLWVSISICIYIEHTHTYSKKGPSRVPCWLLERHSQNLIMLNFLSFFLFSNYSGESVTDMCFILRNLPAKT